MCDKRARTERYAGFRWEKFKNKDSLNDLGVYRIILKWISNRIERRRLDPCGSGQGQVAGFCKYSDKPSGSLTQVLHLGVSYMHEYFSWAGFLGKYFYVASHIPPVQTKTARVG